MIRVFFVFVGEGSSDDAFVPHLEKLTLLCGAAEASGVAIDWSQLPFRPPRPVAARLRAALELEPRPDLIFLHRDADSSDPEPRHNEIQQAFAALDRQVPGVPVVPVRMTEAWLLLDELGIRRAAENPHGKIPLGLPSARRIEAVTDPKAVLREALLTASELTGRRREKFRKTLSFKVRQLLEDLDPEGPITQVSAWQRLRADLEEVLAGLGEDESSGEDGHHAG